MGQRGGVLGVDDPGEARDVVRKPAHGDDVVPLQGIRGLAVLLLCPEQPEPAPGLAGVQRDERRGGEQLVREYARQFGGRDLLDVALLQMISGLEQQRQCLVDVIADEVVEELENLGGHGVRFDGFQ